MEILLDTFSVDAVTVNNKICGVMGENKSRREIIFSKPFIDCTDDVDFASDLKANNFR